MKELHIDEMRTFMELVEGYNGTTGELVDMNYIQETESVKEEVSEDDIDSVNLEEFVNDLKELKSKYESIQGTDGTEEYIMGYERGLYKAAELLENLLSTKYQRRI